MDEDYHASQLTLGICSDGSRELTVDKSDDPELCLIQRSRLHPQAENRDTAQFSKCFGCSFSMKGHRSSHLSRRRDSYEILQAGRGSERSRWRKWDMRTRLANFIQIDRELEISSVRLVRQILYYA